MNKNIKLLLVAIVGMVVFMSATDPTDLPSVLLVVPFVLFFIVAWLLIDQVLKHFGKVRKGSSLLLAGLVVVLMALQSLGQLTLRDAIMVTLLFCVAFLYIKRKAASSGLERSS